MGFYVTVSPSENIQCANGECRYSVQLPKRLTISNNVKVGIVELSYPNSNDYVSELTTTIKLIYIQQENIVKIEAKNGKIKFSSKLKDILGLQSCTVENETSFSKHRTNILANREFLNICSNIVQPDFIKSQWRSVLRRILHTSSEQTYIQHIFIPIYHPISKTDFDTIDITICDDNGIPIAFEKGNLHILLHFS